MSGLSVSHGLFSPVIYQKGVHPSLPLLEPTLRKVSSIALFIIFVVITTKLTFRGIAYLQAVFRRSKQVSDNLLRTRIAPISLRTPTPQMRPMIEIKPGEEFPLLALSDDVIIHIFSFLDHRELITLELVSKRVCKLSRNDNLLWKPLVISLWCEFVKRQEKSWKQVYQETYEGPSTVLTMCCQVQDLRGKRQEILYGERSRVFHLKRRIRSHYKLSPDTPLALVVNNGECEGMLVKDLVQVKNFDKFGFYVPPKRVINFIERSH